jgi:hypothetical protein
MAYNPQSARNLAAALRTRSREMRRVAAVALKQQKADQRKKAPARAASDGKDATDSGAKPVV